MNEPFAAEMVERYRPADDDDPDKPVRDRSVRLENTFQGAGVLTGELTPELRGDGPGRCWTRCPPRPRRRTPVAAGAVPRRAGRSVCRRRGVAGRRGRDRVRVRRDRHPGGLRRSQPRRPGGSRRAVRRTRRAQPGPLRPRRPRPAAAHRAGPGSAGAQAPGPGVIRCCAFFRSQPTAGLGDQGWYQRSLVLSVQVHMTSWVPLRVE
jgi:hypothetical protein